MATLTLPTKLLDREFLGIRCRLIELAATLDRIERADGTNAAADPRIDQIRRSLEILADTGVSNRAERIQITFSLPYEEGTRD